MAATNLIHNSVPSIVRTSEKKSTRLKLVVYVKESENEAWKESTAVTSVSRTGAAFTLSRPCRIGRLVLVKMPMPVELRAYDHESQLYSAIGLVQHCNAMTADGVTVYHVGIGFIGKETPDSFKRDPLQSYCITGARPDGMWLIKEVTSPFKLRKRIRYRLRISVHIAILNGSDRTVARENTITVNIGVGGASVVTRLHGNIGDRVKFACEEFDFYSMAVIRGVRQEEGRSTQLHLQFLDAEFPIDSMLSGQNRVLNHKVLTGAADPEFFYR